MSALENFSSLSGIVSSMKEFVFGENNSRIDTILDYFFNLRQEKRSKIVFYTIISILVVFVLIIILYFFGLYNLQTKLDLATTHMKELKAIQPSYYEIKDEFMKVTGSLEKTNKATAILALLDQKAKELGLETSGLPDKPALVELQTTDPMFGRFQKFKADYTLNNISLRKIIEYVNTIQQQENRIKVTKFNIQQKFGTKLYFDLSLSVEAYIPTSKK